MKINPFLIILLTSLNMSCAIAAVDITATINTTDIRWIDVISINSGNYTSSKWDIPTGVPAAQLWLPGGLSNSIPSEIILTSSTGGAVRFPIIFTGFQYDLRGLNPSPDKVSGSAQCVEKSFDGNIVSLKGGVGCVAENWLDNNTYQYPYGFIRPIFTIDDSQVVAAFNKQPSGNYTGTVNVGNFFEYYRYPGNTVKARHNGNLSVNFNITHKAAQVTNVDLQGSSIIRPMYDLNNDTVKGTTKFKGIITGYFPLGIMLSLDATRVDYNMNGPNVTFIPYSVVCTGCYDSLLVDGGNVVKQSTSIVGNDSMLAFDLDVKYDNVDTHSLESGVYQDNLILLFEPII